MGKIPNKKGDFTGEQKIILDELKNSDLRSQFYFTGGTALSAVYLHHRYSDDLDFFSTHKFNNEVIFANVEKWSKKHGFSFQSRFAEIVYIFDINFKNNVDLKVDFGHYPYRKVEKSRDLNGMAVDSLTDIAVNKLLTVSQRTDVKDFTDLYFLLKQFSIWDLMEGVRYKFNVKIDPLLLASDLLKVEDFDYLPRMIKPLKLEDLKTFFREKAKAIAGQTVF